MAIPKSKRRKISVNDITYYWTVSRNLHANASSSLEVMFRLFIQSEDDSKSIEAQFFGTAAECIFEGVVQNIQITPEIVKSVIERALSLGWERKMCFEYAERQFPNSLLYETNAKDEEIANACRQWFVPYPGVKALQEAFLLYKGNTKNIAESFSGLKEDQIKHWLDLLEIN